jgi:hypothetical protein
MEDKEKQAFKKLLENIVQNREKYNCYAPDTFKDGKQRISVQGLSCFSCNHTVDDHPERYGVTLNEALVMRAYFHNNKPRKFVPELYKEFPGIFEGEQKGRYDFEEDLKQNNIPLLD